MSLYAGKCLYASNAGGETSTFLTVPGTPVTLIFPVFEKPGGVPPTGSGASNGNNGAKSNTPRRVIWGEIRLRSGGGVYLNGKLGTFMIF